MYPLRIAKAVHITRDGTTPEQATPKLIDNIDVPTIFFTRFSIDIPIPAWWLASGAGTCCFDSSRGSVELDAGGSPTTSAVDSSASIIARKYYKSSIHQINCYRHLSGITI